MKTPPFSRISLITTASKTDWVVVPRGATKLTLQMLLASGKEGTTWATELKWSNTNEPDERGESLNLAASFGLAVVMSPSILSIESIPIHGKGVLRMETTTADSAADEAAKLVWGFA